MFKKFFISFSLLLVITPALSAHELQTVYLELKEKDAETYEVLWKVPSVSGNRMNLALQFPDDCGLLSEPRSYIAGTSFLERTEIQCKGKLTGKTISVEGLSATSTDMLVRIERADGGTQSIRLTPSNPSFTMEDSPSWTEMAGSYLRLGMKHILLGIDHLLFVLGLLIIVGRRWMLMLKTISAFTAAHSLTLAASTLGVVEVPVQPLNAVIALSILFLGVEVVRLGRGGTSFTIQSPWVAAFGFGLVHGFGFASGLSTLGLPSKEIVAALLFFNIGVELGQLAFVGLYLLFRRSLRILEFDAPQWANVLPAYIIGSLGAYWTIASTVSFFR